MRGSVAVLCAAVALALGGCGTGPHVAPASVCRMMDDGGTIRGIAASLVEQGMYGDTGEAEYMVRMRTASECPKYVSEHSGTP